MYWGNVIIPLAGVTAGYFYFYNTDEYKPN